MRPDELGAVGGLRVGRPHLLVGGASVEIVADSEAQPEPVQSEAPCVGDEDVAAAGLLAARVFEFGASHEEPVISKEAVVREELRVSRQVDERIEQVGGTVRRMDAEVELLDAAAVPRRDDPQPA